ncbi:hypothetical protein PoB_004752200 [Plakobranchus ocellatus]|uniref:Uncharacterized protein n=1 Tax=Plakobranchus ocellatus TaxID=259542 RepID=A0AAV4BPX7_9GAST|nr:hypothetical protein PoB_004752200 [Plakobranchus ocellatus]
MDLGAYWKQQTRPIRRQTGISGRQREEIMDGLATWLGTGKVLDTLTAVKDRDLWRDMIANAYKQGT